MKWIGQHIVDFIARFRSDVYLEGITTSTETDMLVVDSNNKVSKRAIDAITVDVSDFMTDGADNRILTATGADAMLAETYATFVNTGNVSTLSIISNQDTADLFKIATTTNGATTLTTVDDGGAAADFKIEADGDIALEAAGNDITVDTDNFVISSSTTFSPVIDVLSTSNNAGSGILKFNKQRADDSPVDLDIIGMISWAGEDANGAENFYANITAQAEEVDAGDEAGRMTLSVSNNGAAREGLRLTGDKGTTLEVDVAIANGAASTTTIAGTLTMGSTAFVDNSGVVQVATQGTIDHDSLANFVAAEHVDWAGSSAGTIHSSNIPTLNQNTTGSAATLTTPRAINGVDFDGSAPITVTAAGSTLSDTVTVAKGGTGLTTVGANQILTGNATGALTSEANFTFGVDRLHIGADDEITPQIRMQNDANTVTIGIADSADNLITGSADGDFVINSTEDRNLVFGQNNAVALTVNTDGDVVTAGDLKVNGTDIYGPTDGDMNLRSDGNIALFLDGDGDESSQFQVINDASGPIFTVTEAGVGALNNQTIVTGGKIAVASEAQAPIGMHIARRTITTAEANAMNSTPIEVVPAQGADTIIVPINCLTRVDRAANQTESACDMNAHYADKEPGVYNTASLFHWRRFMYGETTDHSEMRGTTGATSGVTLTESVNKGIELSFDSAATTNCFTSIDIFMTYYIIDIS